MDSLYDELRIGTHQEILRKAPPEDAGEIPLSDMDLAEFQMLQHAAASEVVRVVDQPKALQVAVDAAAISLENIERAVRVGEMLACLGQLDEACLRVAAERDTEVASFSAGTAVETAFALARRAVGIDARLLQTAQQIGELARHANHAGMPIGLTPQALLQLVRTVASAREEL